MEDKAIFALEFPLIQSSNWRKFRNIKHVSFGIVIVSLSLLISFGGVIFHYWKNMPYLLRFFLIMLFVAFVVAIISSLILYLYGEGFRKLGYVQLGSENIYVSFKNANELIFEIKKLRKFKISRGSSFHYAYKDDGPYEQKDNWISFESGMHNYKFEFVIEDFEMNDKFQQLIQYYRRRYKHLYYESI